MPLGRDRVALVRHRRAALLAGGERLLGLAQLGALEVPQLHGQALDGAGGHGHRVHRAGRGGRGRPPGSPPARRRSRARRAPAPRGPGRASRTCRRRPDSLPTARPADRLGEPLLVAAALQRVAGDLQPEGRRLGVDAVGAAHAERVLVAQRHVAEHVGERGLLAQEQVARAPDRQGQAGVEDVGGRHPVVDPARRRAHPLVRRRSGTRRRRGSSSSPAPGCARPRSAAFASISARSSGGITPRAAHARHTASSTSSQRASFASSVHSAAIAAPRVPRDHPAVPAASRPSSRPRCRGASACRRRRSGRPPRRPSPGRPPRCRRGRSRRAPARRRSRSCRPRPGAVPAWYTSAPVAAASSRPLITSPVRGDAG